MDEVFRTIHGARHDLWRAVDQDGHGLALLVQGRRHQQAAKPVFHTCLQGLTDVPRVVITATLHRDGAARQALLPRVAPRQHRDLHHRAEQAHHPTRQRERRLQGVPSPGHAQRFLSAYGPMASHIRPRRHLCSAPAYRQEMRQRFQTWREITGLTMAASGPSAGSRFDLTAW